MQDSKHVCMTLNEILKRANQDTIALATSSKNINFERQQIKNNKKFSDSEIINLYKTKLESVNVIDQSIYTRLIKNLEWNQRDIEEPRQMIRDLAMGNMILDHLQDFPQSKGMLIAHNAHIGKYKIKSKKNHIGPIGWVINKSIGEKYFAIMQDFDEGCFNAYFSMSKRKITLIRNRKNYELGKVCIEESIDHSIGEILRNRNAKIEYITEIQLFALTGMKEIRLHDIGGLFVPQRKNPNQAKHFSYLAEDNWYDAIIFHKTSSPTTLLKD